MLSTSSPAFESRLPVGSSATMTSGWDTSARATATRCCCPPESSWGRCLRRAPSPRRSTMRRKTCRSGFFPDSWEGSRMFSSAFIDGTRLKDWKTKPMRSRRIAVSSRLLSFEIGVSPMITSPESGVSRPASIFSSVDFPEPEGPMIAVKRPASMSMLRSSRGRTLASPSPCVSSGDGLDGQPRCRVGGLGRSGVCVCR